MYYQTVFLLKSIIILPLNQSRLWAMLSGLKIPVWVLFSKVIQIVESKEISLICIHKYSSSKILEQRQDKQDQVVNLVISLLILSPNLLKLRQPAQVNFSKVNKFHVVTGPYIQIFLQKESLWICMEYTSCLNICPFQIKSASACLIWEWSVSIHHFKKEYSSFRYIYTAAV